MADQYITLAYVEAHLGQAYVSAAVSAGSAFTLIESATAVIQTAIRNSGYTPAASTDGTGVEPFVMLATLGAFRELLATLPTSAIPLPESWATSPAKIAYAQILSGDATLAGTPSQIGAVGGMKFTDSNPDNETSIPRRTRKSEMAGF